MTGLSFDVPMIRSKDIRCKLEEIDGILGKKYRLEHP